MQSNHSHETRIEQLTAEKETFEARIVTLEHEVAELNATASELALELAVQYAISRVVETTSSTAEAILDIIQVICEIIGWDMGMVWIVDSQTNRLMLSECWFNTEFTFGDFERVCRATTYAGNEGLPGRVWQSGKPVWVDNITLDGDLSHSAPAQSAGVRAAFGLPIQTSDRVIGVIEFFNHEVRHQDNNLLWMLLSVGSQIGLFIERRHADEELRRRAAEIEDLYNNAPCGYHSLDSEGVFVRINDTELRWLGYTRAELIGKKGFVDLLTPQSANRHQEMLGWLRERGWVSDVEYEVVRKDGSTIPVLLNAVAINDPTGAFAGSRATIFDITERTRVEAAEREQRLLAEALRDIAAALNGSLDLGEVLDHVLANVGRVVPHDVANIMLIEQDKLKVVRVRGDEQERFIHSLQSKTYRTSDLVTTAQAVRTHQAIIIPDTRIYPGWIDFSGAANAQSYLGAPILRGDEVIGVINLIANQTDFFNVVHAERLQAFANQAAIAIQNARLHEQSKVVAASAERQRLARELHDSVSQTLFSASLVAQALPLLWDVEPAEVKKSLEELTRLTRGALAEMRMLMIELKPEAIVKADLAELLQYLSDALTGRTQIQVDLMVEGGQPVLPDVQLAMYRIAQEALNNIIRHARASRVKVNLRRSTGSTVLEIHDNGRGFDLTSDPADFFGIAIMRERADAISAQLDISSQVGHGTEIVVSWQAS